MRHRTLEIGQFFRTCAQPYNRGSSFLTFLDFCICPTLFGGLRLKAGGVRYKVPWVRFGRKAQMYEL